MTQYLKLHGEQLIQRGYSIVPIPPGTKGPREAGWQDLRATVKDVRKWTGNGKANDGVGVLARDTPAIDLDIDDQGVIDALMPAIEALFPEGMPIARIGRAPRLMLVCRTDTPFKKVRSAKYRNTLFDSTYQVEILGDGQQFVAFHIHPDTGQPYTWPGAPLFDVEWASLPVLTLEMARQVVDAFETLAAARVESGEWEVVSAERARGRVSGEFDGRVQPPMGLTDDFIRDVLSHIDPDADPYDTWVSTGQQIGHETGYEIRGLDLWDEWARGYVVPSVNYPGRAELEYKWSTFGKGGGPQATFGQAMARARKNGWVQPIPDDFEALPAVIDKTGQSAPELPRLKRDKHGQIEAVIENVVAVARRSDVFGVRVAYDAFRDDIVVAPHGTDDWLPLRDADYTRYRCVLADNLGFKPVGSEMMRDAVILAAEDCRIDSAQWWLSKQVWDGVPRVERFLVDYFGTDDTPYTRAVARYMWSALAGRILSPGCQVDMVPILEGDQGLRKTSAVAAIAPGYSHFIEIGFDEKETDLARKMRGAMVAELGELHGLHAKAIEGVKKFITRRYENWTPKFKEFNTTFPRRLVFIGTTNQTELLADETGNRRWLPVHVERADVEGIARDRGQLWAEGAAMFRAAGVEFRAAEQLAAAEHEKYLAVDAWEEAVRTWLETESDFGLDGAPGPKWRDVPFTTLQAAVGAVGLQAAHVNSGIARRLGAIFRKLGYKQKTTRIKDAEKPALRWRADFC